MTTPDLDNERSPINPFKDIRLRANLSQYDVAERSGVSKHAVLRLEQGMYPEPLPTLVKWFTKTFNVSRLSLLTGYETFQIETRANNARCLGDFHPLIEDRPVGTHPLTFLREKVGLNPTALAKRLCISQTVVAYFEKRSVHQHTVPEQLIIALHDADYTEQETLLLKSAYSTYRDELNSQINVTPVGTETTRVVNDAAV